MIVIVARKLRGFFRRVASETFYLLTEAGDVLTTEDGDRLTWT